MEIPAPQGLLRENQEVDVSRLELRGSFIKKRLVGCDL